MKIVLVSAVPPPEGGIASWTLKYISYCKKNNIDVIVVNTALTGKRRKQINTKRKFYDEIKRTSSIIRNFRKCTASSDVNIVHINSSCSHFGIYRDYLCVRIAKKRNIPIVFHCHCNIKDQIKNAFGKIIFRKICDFSSTILVLNTESEEFVSSLTDNKTFVVPNFIEKEWLVDSHRINGVIKKIVFVGHVQKTKGVFEIIAAARKMPEIEFILIGPVSEEIKKERLSENISLVGAKPQSDIPRYLKKADLFLFPSYTEGFSVSLTEAMANGLPCIATNVGANVDMLEDKGGIIIPVKDSYAIISAIKKLESVDSREKASRWNIRKVKNNYMLESVMDLVISIYKMALYVK